RLSINSQPLPVVGATGGSQDSPSRRQTRRRFRLCRIDLAGIVKPSLLYPHFLRAIIARLQTLWRRDLIIFHLLHENPSNSEPSMGRSSPPPAPHGAPSRGPLTGLGSPNVRPGRLAEFVLMLLVRTLQRSRTRDGQIQMQVFAQVADQARPAQE